MAKKRRSCLPIFVICVAVVFFFGLVSKLTEGYRGLTHALDINFLPWSAIIVAHGGESWTDYLFVAEIAIAEKDLDHLLSGRQFEQAKWHQETFETTWIPNFSPMPIAKKFSWSSNTEGSSASCNVYVNPEGTRVVVRYISG